MTALRRTAFTLLELLVVLAIIGLLAGLLLSAVQKVRSAGTRVDCQNRLRQAALGMQNYASVRGTLPPGHCSVTNPLRRPFTGWPLALLPHLEQSPLFESAGTNFVTDPFAFHVPPHTGLATVVKAYLCPSDDRVRQPQADPFTGNLVAFTSYLGVSGANGADGAGVLFQDSKVPLSAISDGTSNTLLLGERPPSRDFRFGWWYAGAGQDMKGTLDMVLGVREVSLLSIPPGSPCTRNPYHFVPATGFDDPCGKYHYWSPHSGGANFAFCDGSVRFTRYEADALLPALATRGGGEVVPPPD